MKLEDLEVDFDCQFNGNGLAFKSRGLESVLTQSLDDFKVQIHCGGTLFCGHILRDGLNNVDFFWVAGLIHN